MILFSFFLVSLLVDLCFFLFARLCVCPRLNHRKMMMMMMITLVMMMMMMIVTQQELIHLSSNWYMMKEIGKREILWCRAYHRHSFKFTDTYTNRLRVCASLPWNVKWIRRPPGKISPTYDADHHHHHVFTSIFQSL